MEQENARIVVAYIAKRWLCTFLGQETARTMVAYIAKRWFCTFYGIGKCSYSSGTPTRIALAILGVQRAGVALFIAQKTDRRGCNYYTKEDDMICFDIKKRVNGNFWCNE